jgi:hypothetical protein
MPIIDVTFKRTDRLTGLPPSRMSRTKAAIDATPLAGPHFAQLQLLLRPQIIASGGGRTSMT